jgi:segregation and condensation protein B
MMRLVRDDEIDQQEAMMRDRTVAVITPPTDPDQDAEPQVQDHDDEPANAAEEAALREGAARARRKRNAAAEPAKPAAEQVDGPIDADASEAEEEESDETKAQVDLALLEALLFSTHHPLTGSRLAELMELPAIGPLRKAIKALNAQYDQTNRAFRVEQVAGGYQLLTLPKYGEHLKRLYQREIDTKLTKPAVETLAIIAYKQPILRADVEAIRGVACGETIRSLMEKHLVRIAGRAEEPGRPILYGTTKRFLELFGLNSLKDLPQGEELPAPTR